MDFMKPGDKAIVYLNDYNLYLGRITSSNYEIGDQIWLPENVGYEELKELPQGLRNRDKREVFNIGSAAIQEVLKGEYDLLDSFISSFEDKRFEEAFRKLDDGEAQLLVTYANMLPKTLFENGAPSPRLLNRARKHGWRIGLIYLYADPFNDPMVWTREYIHLVKDDISDGVIITLSDKRNFETLVAQMDKDLT